VCFMASPRNIERSAQRGIDVALGLAEEQEQRLRAILESKQSTPDEKFQALLDLARLAGISFHHSAEAEETSSL
jgi:hypothetical protein